LVEELVESFPTLEIIKEALGGDARADEDWSPAKNLRVAVNYFAWGDHRGSGARLVQYSLAPKPYWLSA
jgi:hypothetical protein